MSLAPELQGVLDVTVEGWFRNFAGTTALDVARELELDHVKTTRMFEELQLLGHGSLNRGAEFVQLSFDPENGARVSNKNRSQRTYFPRLERY